MAMVLLGGLRKLKPETTLAEIGCRAEAVECRRECHDRKIAKTCLFRSLTLKEVMFRKWFNIKFVQVL